MFQRGRTCAGSKQRIVRPCAHDSAWTDSRVFPNAAEPLVIAFAEVANRGAASQQSRACMRRAAWRQPRPASMLLARPVNRIRQAGDQGAGDAAGGEEGDVADVGEDDDLGARGGELAGAGDEGVAA